MKVLMITTSYPDYEGSSRGIFIRRLCRELVNQGLEVLVLTPRIFKQSPLFEEEQGIRVYRFRFPNGDTPLNQLDSIPVLSMCIYMISGLFKAVYLCLKEKPDVIHGNWIVPTGLIASLAGILTRVPVINTARGMDMRVSEKGLVRFLFDLAVTLADKVTIVSEAMKERPLLKKAELYSSGVNDSFFRIRPNHDGRTILFTRSLEKVYDAQTLIRAMPYVLEKNQCAKCIIAGTGSLELALKESAEGLGIADHVLFMGTVPHNAVPGLMESASAFVSTATADGTSIALLEAIASGLIPVVTDISANRSLINHGRDGYLFKSGDERDLADKILAALSGSIPQEILDKKRSDMKSAICWSSIANQFITSYIQLTEKTIE